MTETSRIANLIIKHCHKRNPEGLDSIFDNLPPQYQNIAQELLENVSLILQDNVDTLSWFCAYFAGEINRSDDNKNEFHFITLLSETLIRAGMKPFVDFTPYPGCRIVINNTDKFDSLPETIKSSLHKIFSLIEKSGEQMQEINDALLQELII